MTVNDAYATMTASISTNCQVHVLCFIHVLCFSYLV